MNTKELLPKPHHIPFLVLGVIALACSIGLVLTLLQHTAPAISGNIYVKQPTILANKNEPVVFMVRITPGAQIDTVTTTAKYDTSRLRYEKTEYTDSPFSSQIPATKNADTITIQSAKLGGDTVSTDAYIATILFTALQPGAQTISLIDGNAARAGQATNPAVMGQVIERKTATQNSTTPGNASGQSPTENASQPQKVVVAIASPVTSLLQMVGVSKTTAQRTLPWIIGLLLCAIIAVVVMFIRKKKQTKIASDEIAHE